MKLISMTDFVLEQNAKNTHFMTFNLKVVKYANFLKQPLTLGMFVPCDLEGNVLEEPKGTDLSCTFFWQQQFFNKQKQYEEAKERVLFKAFYVEFNAVISPQGGYLDTGRLKQKEIESLIGAELNLTKSAIKQIGL